MEGVQYIINEDGEKTAALIDLKKYKDVWEDIYDVLISKSRSKEPRESLEDVKKRLIKKGVINW